VQPGSGSSWRRPEDVQTPAHLEQLKYTDEASFKINVSELSGLFANAMRDGREPRLVIEFSRYHLRMVAEIEEVR
jgi:hypothetical protein